EVGRIAHSDLGDLPEQTVTNLGPERGRHEGPRGRRALLALIFEGAPRQRRHERWHIGRGVSEDEILAAGLADDPRIGTVAPDIPSDRLPHALEGRGRYGELDAGQRGRSEHGIADLG